VEVPRKQAWARQRARVKSAILLVAIPALAILSPPVRWACLRRKRQWLAFLLPALPSGTRPSAREVQLGAYP